MSWFSPCHIMDASALDFQSVFRLVNAGAVPSLSAEDLASRISSCLCHQTVRSLTHTDMICLCLTLSERIIARLSSQNLPQDVRMFYDGVIRCLCEMNLMAKLIFLLDCQDQLVSHLSAKCMSACVIRDICMTESISSLWSHTCAEVFDRSDLSSKLDSCLWSLTAVIKGVLRRECGNKTDVLMKLLAALDSSLTCLYINLLPQDTAKPHKTELTKLCRTLCSFFDLLEVLSAARLRCGVCSSVQRIVYVESRALLCVMRSDVEYFVKKRALLLLKRNLLRRSGEDWMLGDVRSADEQLDEDVFTAADVVLQEVKAGWLQEVPVKAQTSFFGGNCDVGVGDAGKDDVMLRALSLILLKSLEINVRSPCGKGIIDVQQYLTELMSVLRRYGSPDDHSCSWVTSVFAEQDDDMMESASALITLYLHQKRLGSSVAVCLWGCNPHCHFIIFLRSISFDHTVLLDFLISTETCFLEYCVRYVKLLHQDWMGFCAACHHVEDCDGNFGGSWDTSETSSQVCAAPCAIPSTGSDVRAGSVPRLVEYDCSDESEEEESMNRDVRNTEVDLCRTDVEASEDQGKHESDDLFAKVLVCLEELKMAIRKLHNRGLFPYNPASLLKLLKHIELKKNRVH